MAFYDQLYSLIALDTCGGAVCPAGEAQCVADVCHCNQGYIQTFSGDDTVCIDINECEANPCDVNADCTNTPGGFYCSCKSGYKWADDGVTCIDIDECDLGTHNCDQSADCTNTNGDFSCACQTGYIGDGITCPSCDSGFRVATFCWDVNACRDYCFDIDECNM